MTTAEQGAAILIPASNAAIAKSPLLKWAGGKRWLVNRVELPLPVHFKRYVEPFFGGGALFFHLSPRKALLGDLNSQLINTYCAVRDSWVAVEEKLSRHAMSHSSEYYYKIRMSRYEDPIEEAARFIYLNRTCWNGLYRVNQKGEFNVPIGTKTKVLIPGELRSISAALAGASLSAADFAHTMADTSEGDFVYVDPPYTVKHNVNGFLKYNQTLFSWEDQIRLKNEVRAACLRGAKVLVSNAAHESLYLLYRDIGEVITIDRASVISGSNAGRKREQEILVKCF